MTTIRPGRFYALRWAISWFCGHDQNDVVTDSCAICGLTGIGFAERRRHHGAVYLALPYRIARSNRRRRAAVEYWYRRSFDSPSSTTRVGVFRTRIHESRVLT